MKTKLKRIVAVAAVAIITITTVYAHSGRTDSSGGHYDRSTGEYHYHHGHPAHQHPNGVCPYEQKDTPKPTAEIPVDVSSSDIPVSPSPKIPRKYNYSSGSGGSSNSDRVSTFFSTADTPAPTNPPEKKESYLVYFAPILIFGWPIILGVIGVVFEFIFDEIKEWKEKRRRAKLPPYIKPEIIIKWGYIKPEMKIKEAPKRWSDTAIGESTYPYTKSAPYNFDPQFTVFKTKGGKTYHRYNCSHLRNAKKIERHHLYYMLSKGFKPCSRCHPPSTVDPWYLELFPEKTWLIKYKREDIK